ncbi:hypothetical protein IWQ61_003642 [Dispira simplex]|nr:hypothetical protein IWQ61_003642 [Dispira simplex]
MENNASPSRTPSAGGDQPLTSKPKDKPTKKEGQPTKQEKAQKKAAAKAARAAGGKDNKPKGKDTASATALAESKKLPLVAHLEERTYPPTTADAPPGLHPLVRSVGLQFAEFKICGSNARCIAMLQAFKQVIEDYQTPPYTTLCRHLPTYLSPQINYLVSMRPLAVAMGNAVRFLKLNISFLDIDLPESNAKQTLIEGIDEFIRERIIVADRVIVQYGLQKIQDGDVVLTYSCSSVVKAVLLAAHQKNIRFRVIVLDSRPLLEGRKLLQDLVDAGIQCTYSYLNSASYVMKQVSKVFLGTHAVLSNGALLSRAGTALVAMTAYDRNIPVIVCTETYKFTERVQLDSFVWNEVGNPHALIQGPGEDPIIANDKAPLEQWESSPNLRLLSLLYDVTPTDYLTMAITEVGMLPFTSVPVVLREYRI